MRIPQILTENLVRQSTRMGVKYCFFIINNITIDHQWNNELKLCGPYSQCGCGEIFSSLESPFYLLAVLFVHWSKISIKRNLVGVLPVDIKKKKSQNCLPVKSFYRHSTRFWLLSSLSSSSTVKPKTVAS